MGKKRIRDFGKEMRVGGRGLTFELPVMVIQRINYSVAIESDVYAVPLVEKDEATHLIVGVLLGKWGDEDAWTPLFM